MDWTSAKLELRKALAAVCHYSGLNALGRRSASQSWRILTYHRVVHPEKLSAPLQPGMYVRPETFELQMRFLKEHTNCVPLATLTDALSRGGELPQGTVVITFDDGWLDNYTFAFPILKKYQLPATIFLATGFIGTHDYFWTDRTAQIIAALTGPAQYREQIRGRLWEKLQPPADIRSSIEQMITTGDASVEAMDNIIELLKARPPDERKQVVNALWDLAKEFGTVKSERLFMNWDEVREMSQSGITFGSHSHRHNPLTELNDAQLRDELLESYQALRSHGLAPVPAFCYPGGYNNEATQRVLRGQDIGFALTVRRESDFRSDPPLLGRINIHEDVSSAVPLFSSKLFGPAIFH